MYEAFNNYVIVKREQEDTKNEFGIITDTKPSNKYRVVATNEATKELQDRIIVSESAHTVDSSHLAVEIKDIIAVCQQ